MRVAFLALEFVPATLRPGREELLEGLLVGGQVLLEAVHRLFVTLTGLLPAEAAAGHGASTGHRPIDNGELQTSDSSPEALGLFGEVCKLNPGSSDWVGLSIPQGIARSPSPEK